MNKITKLIQNVFVHRIPITKMDAKELQSAKVCALLFISVMLIAAFGLHSAISSLTNAFAIKSTGRIATVQATPLAYKSEIRGVFFHEEIFGYQHDWQIIASTLAAYKIDAAYINSMQGSGRRPDSEWKQAIQAFHSRGIKVIIAWNVLGDVAINNNTAAWTSSGTIVNWNSPIRAKALLVSNAQYVASTYDIDGVMFDYIRYDTDDMDYCPEARAAFEQWLDQGPITNWTQFYPNQLRWKEFAEWRNIPVTELVRDLRATMLAIKPNLDFSEAAWTYFQNCPIYWRKFIGQDTGDWIRKDYLDAVVPMMYTQDLTALQDEEQTNLKYMTAGPEGKIPLLAFLDVSRGLTPDGFKAEVNLTRSLGLDGWVLWHYGGPGSGSPSPDMTTFLSAITLPDTFSLGNIQVSYSDKLASITWTTDLPATSKVEYSSTQLFNASWELWRGDFYYWGINHINGTVIEDETLVTIHNMTITGLSPGTQYYFRVQSQDPSGIATSKVLTFTTGS